MAPAASQNKTAGALLTLLLFTFFLLSASDQLRAGDITLLVKKIEVTIFLGYADLGDLLRLAALLLASSHYRARNIAVLINEVKKPFLPLHSYFSNFLSHLKSPPFLYKL